MWEVRSVYTFFCSMWSNYEESHQFSWNISSNRTTGGSSALLERELDWIGLHWTEVRGFLVCFPKIGKQAGLKWCVGTLWRAAEVPFSKPNAPNACRGQLPHSDTSACMCMCLWPVSVCKHTDFPSGVCLFLSEFPMFFRPFRWDRSPFYSPTCASFPCFFF